MITHVRQRHYIPTFLTPLVWILSLATVSVGVFLIFYEGWMETFYERAEMQRRQQLVQLVSVARNSAEPILSRVRSGVLSKKEALQQVRSLVRTMSYQDQYGKNYMFMSAYDGTMLVQPFEPLKEMTNQWELRDDRGVYIIRELVKAAREHPEGSFVAYHYHLPGYHDVQDKLAYVIGLPEINSYIGTGMYLQKAIREQRDIVRKARRGALWLAVALLVPVSAALLVIYRRNKLLSVEIETRAKAEEALKESEEKYRVLVENANSIILKWNGEGGITYLNEYGQRFFGYSLEEIVGKHLMDTIVPETEDTGRDLRKMITDIAASEEGYEKNINENICKNGTRVWVAWSNRVIHDGYGQVVEVFSVGTDISERRKVEAALEKSEDRFRTAVEMLPVGIALMNMAGIPEYANGRFTEIFGYTIDDIPTVEQWFSLAYPDKEYRMHVRTLWEEEVARMLISPGKPRSFQISVCCKDGNVKSIEFLQSIVGDRMLILFNDVTELREAQEALMESEKKFRDLADLLPQALFETDVRRRLTYVNRFGLGLFGYSAQDMEKGVEMFDTLAPGGKGMAEEEFARMMAGALPEIQMEITAIKKNGQEFPALIYASIITREGASAGLRGIIIDMTERKKLESQLFQAQKMEAIGTLAGGIAHDFNNILMGIQGYASLMNMGLSRGDSPGEFAERIEQLVKSATDLTRQLLGFARGGRYEVKAVDLNDVVESTSTMFGRTKKELSIHRKFQSDLWAVEADRGQIEQVLVNLYLNAWHAMAEGGDLSLETRNVVLYDDDVKTHGVVPGRYVQVTAADTGIGMDEKTRERIFEPFFTTKALGRGTGLGLAMVYGIVKGHNGFIAVDSEVGRGTVFTICLPASDKEVTMSQSFADGTATGSESILVVDDEPSILEVNSKILENLGYRIFKANSGQEAVNLLTDKKNVIDLVILDMVMPGMSGNDTFDHIKAITPAVKVILSSGYSLDGQARQIMEKGCDGFLQKPFNLSSLSQEIRRVLGDSGET